MSSCDQYFELWPTPDQLTWEAIHWIWVNNPHILSFLLIKTGVFLVFFFRKMTVLSLLWPYKLKSSVFISFYKYLILFPPPALSSWSSYCWDSFPWVSLFSCWDFSFFFFISDLGFHYFQPRSHIYPVKSLFLHPSKYPFCLNETSEKIVPFPWSKPFPWFWILVSTVLFLFASDSEELVSWDCCRWRCIHMELVLTLPPFLHMFVIYGLVFLLWKGSDVWLTVSVLIFKAWMIQ